MPQSPSENAIYEKLNIIFRDIFDNDEIELGPESTSNDIDGWDSLTHIRILVSIEQEFNIHFNTSEIEKLPKIDALIKLIGSKI